MEKDNYMLKFAKKFGVTAVSFTSEKASFWFNYQEQEPEGVKKFLKKRV